MSTALEQLPCSALENWGRVEEPGEVWMLSAEKMKRVQDKCLAIMLFVPWHDGALPCPCACNNVVGGQAFIAAAVN